MNVLISTWSLEVGGAEILAMNLAAKLDEKKHKIVIFNHSEDKCDPKLVKQLLPASVKIYSMRSWPVQNFLLWKLNSLCEKTGFNHNFHKIAKSYYLKKVIKAEKIDIVSSHSTHSDQVCLKAVENTNTPFIITEHGEYSMFIHQGKLNAINILEKPSVNAIITVSDFCKGILNSVFYSKKYIYTIYNGVNFKSTDSRSNIRRQLCIGDSELVFGLAARGIKEKGWEEAISAFKALKYSSNIKPHLVLLGGSAYVDSLKEKITVDDNIHFVGQVSNPGVYMEAFDVGLQLSTIPTEALSLSLIELLSYKKPVISTNVGGVPEVLKHDNEVFGNFIELNNKGEINIEELTSEMQMYVDGVKKPVLDSRISEIVKSKFSLNVCVSKYERLFNEILNRREKGRGVLDS